MSEPRASLRERWAVRLLAAGASLAAVLLLPRSRMVTVGESGWAGLERAASRLAALPWVLLAGYHDLVFAAAATAVFLLLLLIAPNRARLAYGFFLVVAALSIVIAVANRQVVGWLGRPLTYQWLYYSDFLRSREARSAIVEVLKARDVLFAVGALAAFFVGARVLEWPIRALVARLGWRRFAAAGLAAVLAGLTAGGVLLARTGWDPHRVANPVVFFARSVLSGKPSEPLLARRVSIGAEDFAPRPAPPGPSPTARRANGRVRNVVLFVLESVAASYTGPYGARFGATPRLDSALDRAATFTNVYAHCPTTPSSLASLLLSLYPALSYQSLTEEHPEVTFPSLPSELSRRGYRTAFFSSADARFQRGDVFLAHRGFDRIQDYRSLRCSGPILRASSERFPLLDGVDDMCTAEAFRSWLPETAGVPFFAVFWTMMTHFPYFAAGPERSYGVSDRSFNRYLNGLARSDEALGSVLDALAARGLARSTLVVVLGDHGETFGQHHQRGHGLRVYEENLHIPLVLICPDLFRGERLATVGGMIDVAPTALDVLGYPAPAPWQGRSLFRDDRSGRVYFYAPFGPSLFGLRDGDRKVIFDADQGETEVYDLAADPLERANRAADSPELARAGGDRLAAWAQYQEKYLRDVVGGAAR